MDKIEKLEAIVKSYGSALVAFSGGVDSAFVLKVARDVLGKERVKAVTAKSPSLPERELEEACALARALDVDQLVIETEELKKQGYQANEGDRCYFCKETLYETLRPVADAEGLREILNGTQLDDLGDHRPGLKAAEQFRVKSPLVEAGFTKEDVRQYSRLLGLSTWDKPAEACLSSRIPHGERVTVEKLGQVEKAEGLLKDLGFRVVRVRHHGAIARIEVGQDEMEKFSDEALCLRVVEHLKSLGFLYVTLDLQGYRVGSLNRARGVPQA